MSLDSFGDRDETVDPPEPPRMNLEVGTYALGIWQEGQTLYQYERHPLRETSPQWTEVDHFDHNDPEVQRINFENASAEPQSDEEGNLRTVWIYTETLSRDESVDSSSKDGAESAQSSSRSKKRRQARPDDDRTVGEVGADTTYHRVLYAIRDLADGEDDPIAVGMIVDEIEDPKGTVYSAMTTLYKKKLVDRKKKKRKGEQDINVYWLTKYGEGMLDELGAPS